MNLKLLVFTTVIILLTMFCIVLIDKWAYNMKDGIFNILPKILVKWLECKFCQGFWISLFITIIFYIVFRNNYFVLIPFMSAVAIWRIY